MIFDLHVHSKYSYDSLMSPDKIIKIAQKRELNGIAITDHNTIKGGVETLKVNKNEEFRVIVGSEIKTDYGDIIGLFLNEEIKSRKFEEALDEIKSQGGLSVLAHPYRQYKYPEILIKRVNLIEGFNARSRINDNKHAYELAKKFSKPMTAGSDAHLGFEIGNGAISMNSKIEEALRKGETELIKKQSHYYFVHGCSFIIENIKNIGI